MNNNPNQMRTPNGQQNRPQTGQRPPMQGQRPPMNGQRPPMQGQRPPMNGPQNRRPAPKKSNKTLIIALVSILIIAIIGGLVYMLTSMSSNNSDTPYSEVMQYFDNLQVSEFELDLGSGKMKYKLKDSNEVKSYTVPNVSIFANEVLGGEDAENYRVKYNEANPDAPLKYNLIPISDNSFWLSLIPTMLMLGVMIFFFVFTILPILSSIVLSFTSFDMISTPKFIGIDNYRRMIVEDTTFATTAKNTLVFAIIAGSQPTACAASSTVALETSKSCILSSKP